MRFTNCDAFIPALMAQSSRFWLSPIVELTWQALIISSRPHGGSTVTQLCRTRKQNVYFSLAGRRAVASRLEPRFAQVRVGKTLADPPPQIASSFGTQGRRWMERRSASSNSSQSSSGGSSIRCHTSVALAHGTEHRGLATAK